MSLVVVHTYVYAIDVRSEILVSSWFMFCFLNLKIFIIKKRHAVHQFLTKDSKNKSTHPVSRNNSIYKLKKKSPYKELESSRLVFIHSINPSMCLHVLSTTVMSNVHLFHGSMSSPFHFIGRSPSRV